MKLYISAASPYARKVRVMLIEKKVPHDVETVNLWEPNDLQGVNPLGKVPALQLDDGRVLINSSLIADFLDSRHPDPRFIPADPDLRVDVKRFEALADGMMEAAAASIYEARFHDEARRSRDWLERQRGKIDKGFAALESMLGSRRWCVGDAMSLADLTIACHIGFIMLRRPDLFPQDQHPQLVRLWKTMDARESMKRTAPPAA